MLALEAAFLGLEKPNVPFVHASILELDRKIPLDAVRSHLARVLAEIPRFRQRIERHRFAYRWVDDDQFRIDRHVFETTVSPPGGPRQLEQLAAHLLETRLPAERPPWQVWSVDGLADGRGALITLIHHSLVDGIAGLRLLERVLSGPSRAPATPAPRHHQKLLTRKNARALARLLRQGLQPADDIGLNPRTTSPHRAFTSFTVDLSAIKHVEQRFEVTNNDVVLAAVSGALHRMLVRHGRDPATLHDVRAMVPVGRHGGSDGEIVGNRVVMLLAPLPVDQRDPFERLMHVNAATRKLKRSGTAGGGDLLLLLGQLSSPALVVGVLGLALRLRAFNVVVTNVPGPRRPLSFLGVPLTRIVPVVNLWPYGSLGIAVASYGNTMTFSLHADRDVIPDIELLRDDLAAELEDLFALALHESAA